MWIYILPALFLLSCLPPLLFIRWRYRQSRGFQKLMKRKRDPQEGTKMKEILAEMVGSKANIRTIDDIYSEVRIMEVVGNAVRVQSKKGEEIAINIDFIVEATKSKRQ